MTVIFITFYYCFLLFLKKSFRQYADNCHVVHNHLICQAKGHSLQWVEQQSSLLNRKPGPGQESSPAALSRHSQDSERILSTNSGSRFPDSSPASFSPFSGHHPALLRQKAAVALSLPLCKDHRLRGSLSCVVSCCTCLASILSSVSCLLFLIQRLSFITKVQLFPNVC